MVFPAPEHTENQAPDSHIERSPNWGPNVKLIIGLSIVGILVVSLIYFRNIVGPILLAFVLTYMLHPLAAYLSKLTKLSWRASVNLIFLLLIFLLLGSLTASGLAIVQQVENLFQFVNDFTKDLPEIAADLSTRVYTIGPFEIRMDQFDLTNLSTRLLEYVQPVLTRVGGMVGSLATSAAATLGWAFFVLLISYFLLSGASNLPENLVYIDVPGYDYDIRRLGRELRRIWNAFLRGQLVMFGLTVLSYTILLTVLGVRYAPGIALLAGLARFVPYLGPWVVWITLGLVSLFQPSNYYGLEPWQFSLIAIGAAIILDQIFDNVVSPRFLGSTLGVHPAAVLIAALIATNLIGIIGLILAAPVLATLKLLGRYGFRKMFDLDPWPISEEEEMMARQKPTPRSVRRVRTWAFAVWRRIKSLFNTVLQRIRARFNTHI
ncbi:MAG: AI-2E family transporter [Chloroflexi bacterium]|nr:MAG: AI-2E family transporter [Chloroflexota bacterium]